MDLCDRCGGDRGLIERCVERGERTLELGFDQGARLAPRKGRQAILQGCQIGGDLLAEEVGPRRQKLSELDQARAHLGEGGGEPLARALSGHAAAAPDKEAGEAHIGPDGRDVVEQEQRVVPRQDQRDAEQAGEVAGAAQQPEGGPRRVRGARPNGAQRCPP